MILFAVGAWCVCLGVAGVVLWWARIPLPLPTVTAHAPSGVVGGWRGPWAIGTAMVAGVVVLLLTKVVVVAAAVAALVLWLPPYLRQPQRAQIARLEAMREWTRTLTDLVGVGKTLEGTIERSTPRCPAPIKQQVESLHWALRSGMRGGREAALRAFAADLGDAAAHRVAGAFILHVRTAGKLRPILSDLAGWLADERRMLEDVEATRKTQRREAQILLCLFAIAGVGMAVFARSMLAEWRSPTGQVMLAAVIGAVAVSFWWLGTVSRPRPTGRFLDGEAGGRR